MRHGATIFEQSFIRGILCNPEPEKHIKKSGEAEVFLFTACRESKERRWPGYV
jgi:hypothetical protein